MKKLLIELFFLIVGSPIFLIIAIVGVIYTFIKHLIKQDYSVSKQLIPIVHVITVLFDCFANAGAGELINDLYKISGNIKYGKGHQTISAVTGIIFLKTKDTPLRRFLDKLLGKNHCVDAILENDLEYYKITKQ